MLLPFYNSFFSKSSSFLVYVYMMDYVMILMVVTSDFCYRFSRFCRSFGCGLALFQWGLLAPSLPVDSDVELAWKNSVWALPLHVALYFETSCQNCINTDWIFGMCLLHAMWNIFSLFLFLWKILIKRKLSRKKGLLVAQLSRLQWCPAVTESWSRKHRENYVAVI